MRRAGTHTVRRAHQKYFLWRARRKIGAHRFRRFGPRSLIVDPVGILNPHRIEIGEDVLIHEWAMFSVVESFNGRSHDPHLRIGDRTNFGRGLWLSCVGAIDIGKEVLAGHNIVIADSYHGYEDPHRSIMHQPMAEPRAVRIGDGCILCPHVTVTAGVAIGERSFIAPSSVVTQSVGPNSVVAGNPARVIRRWDQQRGQWCGVASADTEDRRGYYGTGA